MSDIRHVNLAYLHALRTAAARDIPQACAQFRVDAEVAELLSVMTIDELERLSLSNLILFRLDLGAPQLKSFLDVDEARRHTLARLAAERQTKK